MITVYALRWVPEFARGLVRDLRVRWALEEAGIPYRTKLIALGDGDGPEYRALQPFGQVPVYDEDGFVLFESGAIVLRIGENCETLLPKDAQARARAVQWMFAALNSIEPFVQEFAFLEGRYAEEEWAKLRRPSQREFLEKRLDGLANVLGDKPFLDGDRFTAGDLMMASVLRIIEKSDLFAGNARLAGFVARCTARPAFARALAAQLGDFDRAA